MTTTQGFPHFILINLLRSSFKMLEHFLDSLILHISKPPNTSIVVPALVVSQLLIYMGFKSGFLEIAMSLVKLMYIDKSASLLYSLTLLTIACKSAIS